ncbi:DUF3667 domain-containing protein [Tenacibaculum xiamenense]|uniref:DUF3667 domain-containing protein n=1 Tax=Tenacibaculum xiamenense TaxID=1261553 RepID=UPI003896371B
MNCKNCNHTLEEDDLFCEKCGAKVIKERITFRFLIMELFAMLGIDSLFFRTLKGMVIKPEVVLNEYLGGVRKKYVNPFAYLAVGAAASLVLFNIFQGSFSQMQYAINKTQIEKLKVSANKDLSAIKDLNSEEFKKLSNEKAQAKAHLKFLDLYLSYFLKFFNLITFLSLPIYALISKWTFRKPHNYGEHIIINSFLSGTTMFFTGIIFLFTVFINPSLFFYSMIVSVLYYLYSFKRLYELNIKQAIVKLLRFFVMLFVVFVVSMIIIFVLTVLSLSLIKKFNPSLSNSLKAFFLS